MRGQSSLDDIPEPWRSTVASAMQFPIYKIASHILGHATKEAQRAMFECQPATIKPFIAAEIKRIYAIRYPTNG